MKVIKEAVWQYERSQENFQRALSWPSSRSVRIIPQTGVILWDMAGLLTKIRRGNEAKGCRERARAIQHVQNEYGAARPWISQNL